MDNYSIGEFLGNCVSFIRTKMFYNQCRFIRFPFYLRGKKSLCGAKGLTLGRFCRFELDGKSETLIIGERCEFGDFTHIVALNSVVIGNNVLIASKCFISDSDHGSYKGIQQDSPTVPPNERKIYSGKTFIGNNVWIGENAVILSGSKIGNGCVIGANAVLNGGTYEDNSMIVGTPGRIIKRYNPDSKEWERVID